MIYLIVGIFSLLAYHKKYTITGFLLGLFIASSIGAFLVGRQHPWDVGTILIVIYTSVLLIILFFSYKNYGNIKKIEFNDINLSKILFVEKYLTLAGIATIVIELFVISKLISLLMLGMTTASDMHTSEAEQDAIYGSIVSHFYLTICNFLSPIGYILLTLHFYYLIQNNKKKATRYLVLSSILAFHGLMGMSRSATVGFLLSYMCIFYFVMPLLNVKTRKNYLKGFSVVLIIVGGVLMIISNNRFSDYYTKNSKNEAFLDEENNPVLFSLIDYFVMWNENGSEFIRKRPLGLLFYGWYNTAGLPIIISDKILGNTKVNEQREKEVDEVIESYVGNIWYEFQGVIARLTYEWGYIGTVLFILLFFRITRLLSPQKGVLQFRDLLCLPLLLPQGLMFWCGIGIGGLAVQMGMVYAFLFYQYIKKKPRSVIVQI